MSGRNSQEAAPVGPALLGMGVAAGVADSSGLEGAVQREPIWRQLFAEAQVFYWTVLPESWQVRIKSLICFRHSFHCKMSFQSATSSKPAWVTAGYSQQSSKELL